MKNSFNSRLFKSALLISVLGLTILLGVIISGAAYPELLFRVGAPIGMLCCFAGAFLIIIVYACEIFLCYQRETIPLGDSSFDFGWILDNPHIL